MDDTLISFILQVWKAEARDLCACDSGSGSSNGGGGGPTVLVAVKGVKEGAGTKERGDLLRELGIMQHLGQHPNVVTLLGCCTQQGEAFPASTLLSQQCIIFL